MCNIEIQHAGLHAALKIIGSCGRDHDQGVGANIVTYTFDKDTSMILQNVEKAIVVSLSETRPFQNDRLGLGIANKRVTVFQKHNITNLENRHIIL